MAEEAMPLALQPRSPPSAGVTADKDSGAPMAYRVLGSRRARLGHGAGVAAVLNPNRCCVGRDTDRADFVGRRRVGGGLVGGER